jgi:DNA-binding beta-propeller fold protein YncE
MPLRAAVLAAVLAALLAATAAADGGGRAEAIAAGPGVLWTTVPNGVVRFDPRGNRLVGHSVALRYPAFALAAGPDRLWVLRPFTLFGIDANRVAAVVHLPSRSSALAAGLRAVWTTGWDDGTLTRIDPRAARITATLHVAPFPQDVATGFGSVWVASVGHWRKGKGGILIPLERGTVTRVDARTDRRVAAIRVALGPSAIAAGAGAIWALSARWRGSADVVTRIDPARNRVAATIGVPHGSVAIAAGRRYVWATGSPSGGGGVITRIDPATNRAVTARLPRSWVPTGVTTLGGRVWVADPGIGGLIEVDPRTLRERRIVRLPLRA